MSGLFNKKVRRNYRSKAEQSDEECLYEPESLYEQGAKGIICGTTSGDTSKLPKNRSVLSFEDDLNPDEGNVFHVKKSNPVRQSSKSNKERKKRLVGDDIPKVVGKPVVVENVPEPVDDNLDSDRKLEDLRRQLLDLSEPDKEETEKSITDATRGSSLITKGAIPDATTIHLARKQREKAKILLESNSELKVVVNHSTTSNGNRRLIREEDEDDEDDFDDMGDSDHTRTSERRHAFVVSDARDTLVKRPGIGVRLNHRQAELESIRQDFLATEHGSDEASDQETDWERQQIQKAMITQISKLEYLERRMIIIFRERFTRLTERRRQDMKDMADMANQGSSQQTVNAQEDAKVSEARRKRCTERESRRIRRQRARETSAANQTVPHEDGTSTDDEEPLAVIVKRKADIDSYLVDANALFEDVVEEFCELPLILQRFADWRSQFPDSYADAYVALCLPQLFSPIVRIQMLAWNPLTPDSAKDSIEQMNWFRDVLDFVSLPSELPSLKQDPSSDTPIADSDVKLLPLVIEKVVVNSLTACWDPLSSKESHRLLNIVQDLSAVYPTFRVGSKHTEALFAAIVKRLEVTVQEDIFIPLYSKHVMQNRQGPAFQFFERQLRIGIKMLINVLMWHNLIEPHVLQHISLTCLLNRYLLVGLASLLSVASSPDGAVEDLKPPPPPPGGVSFFLPTATNYAHLTTLAFQDTVNYLDRIVTSIPTDWVNSDGLAQLRRFVDQMIDRCGSMKSRDEMSSRFSSSSLEREWLSTLIRLRDSLNRGE